MHRYTGKRLLGIFLSAVIAAAGWTGAFDAAAGTGEALLPLPAEIEDIAGEELYAFKGDTQSPPGAETPAQEALPWPEHLICSQVFNSAKTDLYWKVTDGRLHSNYGMWTGTDNGAALFVLPDGSGGHAETDSYQWTDYILTAQVEAVAANADNGVSYPATGLVFRAQDSRDNYYAFELRREEDTYASAILYKRVDGVNTVLAEVALDPPLSRLGTPCRLTVAARGSSLDCYVNDTRILSAADDTFSAGAFGPRTLYANPQEIYYDGFTVYAVRSQTSAADDASLSGIWIDGQPLPGFSADRLEYTLHLGAYAQFPHVTAQTAGEGASLSITQPTAQTERAEIAVTAADGLTKQVYALEFILDAPAAIPVETGEPLYLYRGGAETAPGAETAAEQALPWPEYFTASQVFNQGRDNLYWLAEGGSLRSNFGMWVFKDAGIGIFTIPADYENGLGASSREWANYVVTAEVRTVQASTGSGVSAPAAGLAFRAQDSTDNYYAFELRAEGEQYVRAVLVRRLDGESTVIASADLETPLPLNGSSCRLTVQADGEQLDCYLNEELLLSVMDNTFRSGTFGVRTLYPNPQTVYFDGLSVYRLGDGSNPLDEPAEDIIMDNADGTVQISGDWQAVNGGYADGHLTAQDQPDAYVRFSPAIVKSGYYEVYVWQQAGWDGANVQVDYLYGLAELDLPAADGWSLAGTYYFKKGEAAYVQIKGRAGGTAAADAVKLVNVESEGVQALPVESAAGSLPFQVETDKAHSTDFTHTNPDVQGGVAYYDGYYYYQQCGVNDEISRSIYKGKDMDHMELLGTYKDVSNRNLDGFDYSDCDGRTWHWFANLWIDPDTGVWYTLVHTEFNYGHSDAYFKDHFRKIGVATSTDYGAHWHYEGDIITSDHATDSSDSFSGEYVDAGAGDPLLFVDDEYFYVSYCHIWNKKNAYVVEEDENNRILSTRMVRCRREDKMAPGSWQKWYDPDGDGQGEWSEPGLGGRDSDVLPATELSYPLVLTYSTAIERYILISKGPTQMDDMHLVMTTCTDLSKQDWSAPIDLGSRDGVWGGVWYAFIFDPDTGSQFQVDDSFRLYYHANGYPQYKNVSLTEGETPCLNYSARYPSFAVDDGTRPYDKLFGSKEYDTARLEPQVSGGLLRRESAPLGVGGTVDLLYKNTAGASMDYTVYLMSPGVYDVYVRGVEGPDRGAYTLSVNGEHLGGPVDQYNGAAQRYTDVYQGRVTIDRAGEVTFSFTSAGKNPAASEYKLAIDALRLERVPLDLKLTAGAWTDGEAAITVDSDILTGSDRGEVLKWAAGEQDASYFENGGYQIVNNVFTVREAGMYTVYAATPWGDWEVKTLQIEQAPPVLPGDFTEDGRLSIEDVMEGCRVLARGNAGDVFSPEEIAIGDMNGNGMFNIEDIMLICRQIARQS